MTEHEELHRRIRHLEAQLLEANASIVSNLEAYNRGREYERGSRDYRADAGDYSAKFELEARKFETKRRALESRIRNQRAEIHRLFMAERAMARQWAAEKGEVGKLERLLHKMTGKYSWNYTEEEKKDA